MLVEVDCNTDFVAKKRRLHRVRPRHRAAHRRRRATRWVTEEDVPEDAREPRSCASPPAGRPTCPSTRASKIAEGKVSKWLEEVVLLKQVHVNGEKYENKTIEQLRAELSAQTGENVVIRRFARFAVGEA